MTNTTKDTVVAPLPADSLHKPTRLAPHPRQTAQETDEIKVSKGATGTIDCLPQPLGDAKRLSKPSQQTTQSKKRIPSKTQTLTKTPKQAKPQSKEKKPRALLSPEAEELFEADSTNGRPKVAASFSAFSQKVREIPFEEYAERASESIWKAYDSVWDFLRSKLARRLGLALLALVFLVSFGYLPVRSLYVAQREGQVLSAQLAAINEENEELAGRLATLQSREGIEDEAHRRGYVYEGEELVELVGVSEEEATVVPTQKAAPEKRDFVTELLDSVFAYHPGKI